MIPNGMLKVNTVLTGMGTVLLMLLGFMGREIYVEMRSTHDAILTMSQRMVSHSEFDVAITTLRDRQSAIEIKQTAIELELRNLPKK